MHFSKVGHVLGYYIHPLKYLELITKPRGPFVVVTFVTLNPNLFDPEEYCSIW